MQIRFVSREAGKIWLSSQALSMIYFTHVTWRTDSSNYSFLHVLLVYEMTWDWTATFSNQSSFDGLEGKIVTLSKNWFSSALWALWSILKMLPRSPRSFRILIRHVRRCSPCFHIYRSEGKTRLIPLTCELSRSPAIIYAYTNHFSIRTFVETTIVFLWDSDRGLSEFRMLLTK